MTFDFRLRMWWAFGIIATYSTQLSSTLGIVCIFFFGKTFTTAHACGKKFTVLGISSHSCPVVTTVCYSVPLKEICNITDYDIFTVIIFKELSVAWVKYVFLVPRFEYHPL